MKSAAACLLVALALGGAPAMAQAAGDPMDKLRACSTLSHAERMKCLDLLSREIAPESARPRAASGSEGTATPEQLDLQRNDFTDRLFARCNRHCHSQRCTGRLRHEAFDCVSRREYIFGAQSVLASLAKPTLSPTLSMEARQRRLRPPPRHLGRAWPSAVTSYVFWFRCRLRARSPSA